MKTHHKLTMGIALSMAIAGISEAGVIGSSVLEISNFTILNTTDNTLFTQVSIRGGNRSGTLQTNYNGVINNSSTPVGGVGPTDNIDFNPICSGDCLALPYTGNNDVATHLGYPAPTGSGYFAYGDLFVSGSALATGGANGFIRSDAIANSPTNIANSNGTITNNVLSLMTFTADASKTVYFSAGFDIWLNALITADLIGAPGSYGADASSSFTVEVTNSTGNSIISWNPSEVNRSINAFATSGFNERVVDASGTMKSNNFDVIKGQSYTVAITQKATANVSAIPEPASLALIGLGLLGLAGANRRRPAGAGRF